ncbi:hypothetical protein A5756_20595 [Mycobacterium sp. 852002-53434_SCH5985345]|nr:hypothetical protein A5756_20595 [Mycobacterium sp. 852002-53434_SCH5985345]
MWAAWRQQRTRNELAGEALPLAVLLGCRSHNDEAVDALDGVQRMVEAPVLICCIAQAILAARQGIEAEPVVAMWLASRLAAETFALDLVPTSSGGPITGYRFDRAAHDLHLLLPDPYTFQSSLLIEHVNSELPGTTVVGGVVRGARRRIYSPLFPAFVGSSRVGHVGKVLFRKFVLLIDESGCQLYC